MTKKITTSACMLALAVILSVFTLPPQAFGGSVTVASALPVAVCALLYPTSWGLLVSLVFSLLQMFILSRVPAPPVQNLLSYAGVVLLDYIIAFGVIGLAGFFHRRMGGKIWAIPVSVAAVITLRFFCHFISGIVIWGVYAPEGQSAAVYSLIYNGAYMLPELVITTAAAAIMTKFIHNIVKKSG